MSEVLIRPAALTAAAQYLKQIQNDAIWERLPERARDRYREQVIEVLRLCGLTLPGVGEEPESWAGCNHPRLVPRYPCPECAAKERASKGGQ